MNQLLDAEQVFREVPSSQQRVVICSPRVSKHWCKNGASRQSLLGQKHSNHLGSAPIPPRTHQTKFSVGVFTMASARPASSPKKKFTSHALSENWASVVADQ